MHASGRMHNIIIYHIESETKWPVFAHSFFQINFLVWNLSYFLFTSIWNLFAIDNTPALALIFGLSPNRLQVINWTYDTHTRTHAHTHTRIIFKMPWWTEFGGHCTNVSLLLLSSVGTSNVQYVLIISLQYVGMYVISWSIFLLIIEKIFVLHLIIVVKSVCTLSHSLFRFHETILNMCFITFSYSVKKK